MAWALLYACATGLWSALMFIVGYNLAGPRRRRRRVSRAYYAALNEAETTREVLDVCRRFGLPVKDGEN